VTLSAGRREVVNSIEDCEAGVTAREQVQFQREIGRDIKPHLEEAPSHFQSTLRPALSRVEFGMNVVTSITEAEEPKADYCDVDKHRRTDCASAFPSRKGISRPKIIPATIKAEESIAEDGGQEGGDSASMDRKVNDEENPEYIRHRGDDDNTFSSSDTSPESSRRTPASKPVSAADPTPSGTFTNKKLHPMYFLFVAPPAAASIAWK
ncbi:unnamed protein product, partial [Ascophyllum nodosum]